MAITAQEAQRLRDAKARMQQYHYGTLYYKRAHERYVAIQMGLAKKHHCSLAEVESAEKRKF
ncbi:MAG: hypothetical protein IJZ68_08205 [Bacteroidaceae bacterium]|nr:hypothetical protein [Bacteroidaceae bacterium]